MNTTYEPIFTSTPAGCDVTKQPISLLAALEIVTLFVKNRTFKQMQVIPLSKNSAKKNLFTIPVYGEWTAFNGPAEFK